MKNYSEKNVTIRGAVVGDSVYAGNNPTGDEGTIKLVADDIEIEADKNLKIVANTSTTIGSNGSASAPTTNPVGYLKININGTDYQVPYYNV